MQEKSSTKKINFIFFVDHEKTRHLKINLIFFKIISVIFLLYLAVSGVLCFVVYKQYLTIVKQNNYITKIKELSLHEFLGNHFQSDYTEDKKLLINHKNELTTAKNVEDENEQEFADIPKSQIDTDVIPGKEVKNKTEQINEVSEKQDQKNVNEKEKKDDLNVQEQLPSQSMVSVNSFRLNIKRNQVTLSFTLVNNDKNKKLIEANVCSIISTKQNKAVLFPMNLELVNGVPKSCAGGQKIKFNRLRPTTLTFYTLEKGDLPKEVFVFMERIEGKDVRGVELLHHHQI